MVLLISSVLLTGKKITGESLLRIVYRAGQLVSLNQEEPDPAEHPSAAERLTILVAQMLAVVAVAMLGFEFFRLLGGRAYERIRTVIRRPIPGTRVMVVGDGPAASSLVDGLFVAAADRKRRILVTMLHVTGEESTAVRPLGALMVVRRESIGEGDFRALDVERMSLVVVMGEGDASNLALASCCTRALPPGSATRVSVRIDSPECAAQVRGAARKSQPGAPLSRVRVFCPDSVAASRALSAAGPREPGRLLVQVGFGASGSAFVAEWLRSHPGADEADVLVLDPHAPHSLERFRANYRDVAGRGRFRSVREVAHPDLLKAELLAAIGGKASSVTVSVSVGDVDRNLSIALLAVATVESAGVEPGRVSVILRQSLLHPIDGLLDAGSGTVPLMVWGGLGESFTVEAAAGADWLAR